MSSIANVRPSIWNSYVHACTLIFDEMCSARVPRYDHQRKFFRATYHGSIRYTFDEEERALFALFAGGHDEYSFANVWNSYPGLCRTHFHSPKFVTRFRDNCRFEFMKRIIKETFLFDRAKYGKDTQVVQKHRSPVSMNVIIDLSFHQARARSPSV